MMRTILKSKFTLPALLSLVLIACQPSGPSSSGAAGEINIYSARHYDADEQLYGLFEKETGIRLNRIEMKGDLLLERLKAEGAQSPADVVLLVDAGNFYRGSQAGLFQPINSTTLKAAIPANLHGQNDQWFGFAKRARVIAYDKSKFKPEDVPTYEALAGANFKGQICSRPSSNIYNLSLMAALIDMWGVPKAESWAKAVVGNFARQPEGSDTDQLMALGEGKCGIAIVNHYYAVRMQRSDKPEERTTAAKIGLSFPDQATTGTHVNVSGGALAAHAPNRANAVKFLEFLASPQAQTILSKANDEFPVVANSVLDNPELEALKGFKEASTSMVTLGTNQAEAQKVFDRAGWK
jgi:iron(III) transport system substrate-binding protein